MRRLAALCLLVAACGHVEQSDWEREHEDRLAPAEEALLLPAYPREAQLIPFSAAGTSGFRFFIDAASVSVGNDGVVRYTLVARSAEGAQNVSYEGMRCETGEVRIYAVGRDGGWSGKPGEWRSQRRPWHQALYREYFCPFRQVIRSRDEGLEALRR